MRFPVDARGSAVFACLGCLVLPECVRAENWDRMPALLGFSVAIAIAFVAAFALLWWLTSKIPNAALRAVIRGCALVAMLWANGRLEGPGSFSPLVALPVAIFGSWLVELNLALKKKLRERD